MTFISVVSPVYKAEKIIPELVKRIEGAVLEITDDFEIILVEDGGPDDSWEIIEGIAKNNPRVKGIKLSRNFGQHYAITAGLDHTKGEWVLVMDCDLQDVPEEIPELYKKALDGFYVVQARREKRRDGMLKRIFSLFFYSLLSWLTGTKHDPAIANFGIYHRFVVDSICSMKETIRYFPTMVKWVGFNAASLNVRHEKRSVGRSSYSFRKLLHLALEIILAYSDKPLRLTVKLGVFISASAILFAFYSFIRAVSGNFIVPGYASLIVSVWLLSGIVIFILGVVGLYVGKTFEGVKNRPVYIIEKIANNG